MSTTSLSPARKRPVPRRSDQEFLPAALEILETPASPARLALLLLICGFLASALAWSYFSRIDIFAVAAGKIRPIGQIKTIEPLETGRIRAIRVDNGAHVKAGDILVELDTVETEADVGNIAASLAAYQAEAVRRRAAIETTEKNIIDVAPAIPWPEAIPANVRMREEQVLRDDLASLRAELSSLTAKKAVKTAERDRLIATTTSQAALIETLQSRVDMRNTLMEKNAGTRTNLFDALQALQSEKSALAANNGWLEQAKAEMVTFAVEATKIRDAFISDNSQKKANAERQADDLSHRLIKAKASLEHKTLTSPIDGTVQSVSVTTIGQVVTTGQELMRVVPANATLEIEAYVENKDIAFVHKGQEAIVKVEAFPFTRYGTISGLVTHVAADSIPAPEAQRAEGDPTQAIRQQDMFAGASRVQALVYPVTLTPSATFIAADGNKVPLGAGMTVSVEIKTGSRRVLEYLFSPLVEVSSQAMRER
ncbi:HlyD family type I secretion periplasmic adaptor subunit [Labrys sp. WJW]|uniref:HlyD family type I secretion periplasmic adaptor subunit n=1 Tax=Labrys sp. WJW TaxID=1737983 RepID=UPI000AB42CA0|nr:HlyD family type I secretion periplasmic adaptor subunit [Labrys sp. WJW]